MEVTSSCENLIAFLQVGKGDATQSSLFKKGNELWIHTFRTSQTWAVSKIS